MQKIIKIGLLGLGTVGGGVFKTIENLKNVKIEKIAVGNITKKRDIEGLTPEMLTTDGFEIVNNPEIDVVVELIGGIHPAYEYIKTAISNKKHIVTANKELIAKHGEELFELAKENNVSILFEAAVAGGIPIITPIKTTLAGNKIEKVAGILNGTTNFILTKMEKEKAEFSAVLAEAQKLGYAEADPSGDVQGFDAGYKIAILAALAFNKRIDVTSVYKEGIDKISPIDIEYADAFGYKIKLIALAQQDEDGEVDVRVHPMLVSKKLPIAHIDEVMNAVVIAGHPVGQVMFSGPGAGEFATASSVIGDIMAIAEELPHTQNVLPMMRCRHEENAVHKDINETLNKYYIRLNTNDIPGVIGELGTICGKNKINLSTILQKEIKDDGTACIVLLTALSKEDNLQNAVEEFRKNKHIKDVKNVIRVMD